MKGVASALVLIVALMAIASTARADVGVGVSLGRIEIDDELSPGGRYRLPTLSVVNTGDESGDYEVVVSYAHDQNEKRPPEGWFEFQPQRFFLKPGGSQAVAISVTLPTGAGPGDYFAFIEVHSIPAREGVTVGVAAATKLSFTVKPSNVFSAWLLRISNFFEDGAPWSYLIPSALLALILLYLLRRYIRVRLSVERRR
jgi:hypothetical protein